MKIPRADNHKSVLVPQSYWEAQYQFHELVVLSTEHPFRRWIESYVPRGNGDCFEIGCYPGQVLAVLGELGYRLNGLDLTSRVEKDLPKWLRTRGYRVGEFCQQDFLRYQSNSRYELVCSFGFMEHFTDWESILHKHMDLVALNGHLVITVPNFLGFVQYLLHYLLDRKNLERHNLKAMDPNIWEEIVSNRGFEIIRSGYFGQFHFWVDRQKRNRLQLLVLREMRKLLPKLRKLPPDIPVYAPYCGLIAKCVNGDH